VQSQVTRPVAGGSIEPALPGGGVRLRSYNREEYPDENYTNTEVEGLKILGRMFWSSVLW